MKSKRKSRMMITITIMLAFTVGVITASAFTAIISQDATADKSIYLTKSEIDALERASVDLSGASIDSIVNDSGSCYWNDKNYENIMIPCTDLTVEEAIDILTETTERELEIKAARQIKKETNYDVIPVNVSITIKESK